MNAYALILCGGSGTRMGADENKTLLKVGGVPAVVRCFQAFQHAVKGIVLVTRAGEKESFLDALASYGCTPLAVVTGGADRQASALNGLMALPTDADGVSY
jgi:2-C-methyl-D-erythritol 4-phosphate cytidylyltransferase